MNLRNIRIPEQGTSNFTRTHTTHRSTPFIESIKTLSTTITKAQLNASPAKQEFTSSIKSSRQQLQPKLSKFQQVSTAVPQIRKAFKGKGNIWRIAKSWKFAKKGHILEDDLKRHMEKCTGVKISVQESEMIMEKYGNKEGRIDIQNFLNLIYGENEYSSYQPALFDVNDCQKVREEKINNLIDKLQFYETSKKEKRAQGDGQQNTKCMGLPTFEQKARKTMTNCEKLSSLSSRNVVNDEFAKQQFFRLTHDSCNKFKQAQKHRNLHPQTMTNRNQTKTRFNCSLASVKTSTSNFLTNYPESLTPWDPCLQKAQKLLRQKARQDKIRLNAEFQKENISCLETKNMEKQSARLLRKRLDRQAYDYSNFLKNSWL